MLDHSKTRIGVIGLGSVGLPLAVEFAKQYPTIGFDVNETRIKELKEGRDSSLEMEPEELLTLPSLTYTHQLEAIRDCNVYIVTVPTPVNQHKQPDLSPLLNASRALSIENGVLFDVKNLLPAADVDARL